MSKSRRTGQAAGSSLVQRSVGRSSPSPPPQKPPALARPCCAAWGHRMGRQQSPSTGTPPTGPAHAAPNSAVRGCGAHHPAMAITLRTTLGVDLDLGKGAAEAFLALSSAYPATPSQVLAIPFMRSAASPERLAAMVADAEALQKGGRALTALAEAVLGDIVTFGTAALASAGHPLQASAPLRKGEAGELRTVLAAHMHRAYTVYLDELTIAGRLSREERMAAGNIVGKALEVLEEGFDTVLGRRAVTAPPGEGVEKAEWTETEHPRDATGEFTAGPSGGSAAKPEPPKPTGGLGTAARQRLKELGVKKYPRRPQATSRSIRTPIPRRR